MNTRPTLLESLVHGALTAAEAISIFAVTAAATYAVYFVVNTVLGVIGAAIKATFF